MWAGFDNVSLPLLSFAAEQNLPSWIEYLLNVEEDCNFEADPSMSPLSIAVYRHNKEAIAVLLRRGAFFAPRDKRSRTPLHYIASSSDMDLLHIFWDHIPPPYRASVINIEDKFGETPLHLAVWQCNEDMVKELLRHGADVNIRNKYGETPLHLACFRDDQSSLEICRVLLDASAKTNHRDLMLEMPLDIAIHRGFTQTIKLINEHERTKQSTPCNLM
jgi:ankyrin repeat protein